MTLVEDDLAREPDEATLQLEERRRSRGQAAVERERAAEQREAAAAERDRSQAEADQRTWSRGQAAGDREYAAADRDHEASHRDGYASDREASPPRTDRRGLGRAAEGSQRGRVEAAQRTSDRGQAAEDRRRAHSDREQTATDRDESQAEAEQRTSNRDQSASDRECSAADRRASVADRVAADRDHEQARAELRRAQLDQLTGAFGREIGMVMLEREINRARRANERLVLAYIDVDGLKQVNDLHGHSAGDGMLRDIAHAIQKHLRSYDTLVRVGGDEFVCALVDCNTATARRRFQEVQATIHRTEVATSISVGFAALHSEDTLESLTARADQSLYEHKRPSNR